MRLLLALFLCFLPCSFAFAQANLTGVVRFAGSDEQGSGINVILREVGRNSILGYDITDDEGVFDIAYKTAADSVSVSVTGFNVKTVTKVVPTGTKQLDFIVEQAKNRIREVKVTASAITRQSDTVTYYVENFRDDTDRSIGEVLKKLPGIQVEKSGEIKYNGKSINKFYIEGMDMLGGRYGIATNNVQAKDIAAVEVYEDHQPIKVLQDWVKSDRAAINLRLKDSAKGTWNVILQGGVGYKPFLWDVEALPMFFGKGFQTISTYKTNNTGKDVARELESHYGELEGSESVLHVSMPQLPPIEESRYLDNNVHALSVNTITKLSDDTDLTADVSYIHDNLNSEGSMSTTYFIPGQSPHVVEENIKVYDKKDILGVNLQLRNNSKTSYLLERLSFEGHRKTDFSDLTDNDGIINQSLSSPELTLRNWLHTVRIVRSWNINFESTTDWDMQSSQLTVQPTPYTELFGTMLESGDAIQDLDTWRFRTDNNLNVSRAIGNWTLSMNATIRLHLEDMKSSLYGRTENDVIIEPADSLNNGIRWSRFDVIAGPSATYKQDWFTGIVSVPLDIMNTMRHDRIIEDRYSQTNLLFSPRLSMLMNLTYRLRLNVYGNWTENAGNLYDSYSGYVMTDYRTIGKKSGMPRRSQRQTAALDIIYTDALNGLFATAYGSWWRHKENVTSSTFYEGDLMINSVIPVSNISQGLTARSRISKRLESISTTISANVGWNRAWYEYMRQNVMVPTIYDQVAAGMEINSRLGKRVTFVYEGNYIHSASRINDDVMNPIDGMNQNADFSVTFDKGFVLKAGVEHHFNNSVKGDDRNMLFADASLAYKRGRFEYMLEANNIFNTDTYSSFAYNDILSYSYTTSLRPFSLMLKVRFSLR